MNRSRLMNAYVVPISVYLGVAIAGGYGTGREVIQFFTAHGPWGGLYGVATAALVLSLVTAASFEFARMFQVYDYRSFFKELIGPFWVLFEILYILLFLIVLAVVAAAAGSVMSDRLGAPANLGLGLMLVIIAGLLFFGRRVVERSLVVITALLFSAFLYYFLAVISVDGPEIAERLADDGPAGLSWLGPALIFSMYSAMIAAVILFSTTGITTRRDAVTSGAICGAAVMIPGFLFHISFLARADEIATVQVPVYWMIEQINAPLLMPVYLLAMFGTFLGTGLGFLQAVTERLDAWSIDARGRPLPRLAHVGVAVGGLLISAGLGQFGIIALISQGYSTIGWGFLFVFIIPVLTIGVYKIRVRSKEGDGNI